MGSCYVYIVAEAGQSRPVKIGKATDPKARLSGLQTGNPRPLEPRHTILIDSADHASRIESALHGWFSQRRVLGEWFDVHWKEAAIVADKMAEIDEYDFPPYGLPELDLGWDFSPDAA